MCVAAWSDLPNKASIGTLSRGWDDTFYFLPVPSRLLAIHIIIKALASIDNQNNTKVMRYLDGGDVCWFIFGVGGIVGGGRTRPSCQVIDGDPPSPWASSSCTPAQHSSSARPRSSRRRYPPPSLASPEIPPHGHRQRIYLL